MNVRALKQLDVPTSSVGRAEHISLEADIDLATPAARTPYRKTRASYVLKSALRKHSTELSLLEECYLQIRTVRKRKEPLKYAIDLRFLNSQPMRVRRVAWGWFVLSAALAVIAGCSLWLGLSHMLSLPLNVVLACGGAAVVGALVTLWSGLLFTTESLNFTSVHGGATLVSVVGGLGSTKKGKAFFVSMIKDIAAAKAARPQNKQQWLRDEMREHHRLRELGVVSEAEYEASKARILGAHS